jgi:ornithine cyclodeaminase/alanine dehydrogenase-like protein (mu-crystallin family)
VATLVLSGADVRAVLDPTTCLAAVEGALAALATKRATQPLRSVLRLADRRLLGLMPGHLADPDTLGTKVIAVCPANAGSPFDTHQGVVLLHEPEHGLPQAILDASAITEIRTAAASALATRLLARPDSRELALLGTGIQARSHLAALLLVRPIERVRVHGRDPRACAAFARAACERHGVRVEAAPSAQAAVEGADVVCTATSSKTPVLEGRWLAPGTHVNAVGACVPDARELDTEAVARARVFVDRRESAEHEAGDLLIPLREGAIRPGHVRGELGELVTGRIAGRESPADVTLFKSLGIAVEDLAAARVAFEKARAEGLGTWVDLGGRR